jgi:hypothetical protein
VVQDRAPAEVASVQRRTQQMQQRRESRCLVGIRHEHCSLQCRLAGVVAGMHVGPSRWSLREEQLDERQTSQCCCPVQCSVAMVVDDDVC